jgi:hypothetical protein
MNAGFPFPAVIPIKIRKIIERFKQHGALTPDSALPLDKIGVSKRLVLRRLIRHGVIIETAPDKYYLDEKNLFIYNRNRRTRARIILIILIIAIAIYILLHLNS